MTAPTTAREPELIFDENDVPHCSECEAVVPRDRMTTHHGTSPGGSDFDVCCWSCPECDAGGCD